VKKLYLLTVMLYNIILLEPFIFFFISYDAVTMKVTYVTDFVTVVTQLLFTKPK